MLAKLIKVIMGMIIICVLMSQPWSLASIFAVFIGIGFAYILYKVPIKESYFIGLLVLFLIVTRGANILLVQTPLESDFLTMHTISEEMIKGNLSDVSLAYMNEYSYQIPYILYQAGLLVLNPELLFLKCLNVVYSVITVLCIYSIAKKLASKGSARVACLLYALAFFPMTYTSVISNQWSSTIFLLLGIRLLLGNWKQHTVLKTILLGACIAIAELLRPDAIIVVLAIIAYFIYHIILQKEKWKLYTRNILVFLLVYGILTNGVMAIIKSTDLVTNPQADDYLWKFVCGLNSNSHGRWNLEDFNTVYAEGLSREERDALELEMIKERIQNTNFLSLWHQKIDIYWNGTEYFWAFGYTQNIELFGKQIPTETLLSYAKKIDKAIWGTILVLAFIGLPQKRRKAILLYTILIGTFLIYLWIEIQGRYSYFTNMMVFILAGMGLDRIVHFIHHRKKGEDICQK